MIFSGIKFGMLAHRTYILEWTLAVQFEIGFDKNWQAFV